MLDIQFIDRLGCRWPVDVSTVLNMQRRQQRRKERKELLEAEERSEQMVWITFHSVAGKKIHQTISRVSVHRAARLPACVPVCVLPSDTILIIMLTALPTPSRHVSCVSSFRCCLFCFFYFAGRVELDSDGDDGAVMFSAANLCRDFTLAQATGQRDLYVTFAFIFKKKYCPSFTFQKTDIELAVLRSRMCIR